MRSLAALALILLTTPAAACLPEDGMKPPANRSTDLRPPRDHDIAVQEELDAARRAGTLAAYDLFLARHGDHALAGTARRERAETAARAPK